MFVLYVVPCLLLLSLFVEFLQMNPPYLPPPTIQFPVSLTCRLQFRRSLRFLRMFFSSFFLRMFFSSVFLLPRRRQTGVPKETLLTISQPKHCDAELKKKKLFLNHESKDACNLYMRRVCRLRVRAQVCVSSYDLKFPTTCAHTFYI